MPTNLNNPPAGFSPGAWTHLYYRKVAAGDTDVANVDSTYDYDPLYEYFFMLSETDTLASATGPASLSVCNYADDNPDATLLPWALTYLSGAAIFTIDGGTTFKKTAVAKCAKLDAYGASPPPATLTPIMAAGGTSKILVDTTGSIMTRVPIAESTDIHFIVFRRKISA